MSSSATRRAKVAEEKAKRKLDREAIVLEFDYQPAALRYHGPVITTSMGLSGAHREALEKAGQAIPDPVQCRFLLDTGADSTIVKHEFAERAGLKLINDNVPFTALESIPPDARIWGGSYLAPGPKSCQMPHIPCTLRRRSRAAPSSSRQILLMV